VTVFAHRDDAGFIRGEAAGPEPVLLGWERELLAQVQAGMSPEPAAPVRVDFELVGGEILDNGGLAVAVPGHTPGSVALYLPGPGVLFTGDTIARRSDGGDNGDGDGGDNGDSDGGDNDSDSDGVILGVFNVDRDQAIESFRRQAELDVEIACFGHGDPLTREATTVLRRVASGLTD
jgi:glyoxylase-like metal-dependent hydrolase (beta-lactamase superfamily II)